MNSLIAAAARYVGHHGYRAIFFGVLLEGFGMPFPGETLIIVGGLFAAKGKLSLLSVISLGILGAFIGNNIGYAIGYFGGRRLLVRYGKFIFVNEKRLRALEDFFRRHGNETVVFARFFAGLRQLNGLLAGVSRMPWLQFILFNLIGAILWVGGWALGAYFLENKLRAVFAGFEHFEFYFLIALVLLVSFVAVYHALKRSRPN